MFAGHAAFGFTLDKIGWFGGNDRGVGRPGHGDARPPPGRERGRHAKVIPHLTVGDTGGPQALQAAAESVRPCLPIEAVATEVTLMAGPRPGTPGTPPHQWRTIAAFPLADGYHLTGQVP
jgi:hypothetical protein